jgi:asparagine synthase (glutamine-hydrolysing)
MTFTAAVAAGPESADSLAAWCERNRDGTATLVRDRDLAVAWSATCRWIDTHDDGDVLVVLDGCIHRETGMVSGEARRLHARYLEVGADVARGVLGDFVLVVLDRGARKLLVSRDPLGVRPWYLASNGRRHAGASDVATLASLPWVDTTLDERIAIEYLAAVYESRGPTLHRGIVTLAPGTTWAAADGATRTLRHHDWRLEPDIDISWDDAAARCRSALDEAVRSRYLAGGTATSELSGGLDSSAVVGTLIGLGAQDQLLVGRLVFERGWADEREYSDAVVDHWRIPMVSAAPWVPDRTTIEALGDRLRRPPPDPHFLMFATLHEAFRDAGRDEGLTGLGGDDAFATCGAGGRVVSAVKLRQRAVLAGFARTAMRDPREGWQGILRPALHHLAPWKGHRLPGWVSVRAAEQAELRRLFRRRPVRVTGVDAIDERFANITSGYDAALLENRAVVCDEVDRRESHPYLDPRFIEATYGLDPAWPTRGGHSRALQVAAYADRLPPAVAERRTKADFSSVFWPQLLAEDLLAEVEAGPLADLGWLHAEGFENLVEDAKKGAANAAIPLSRCVNLDRWLRQQ